MHDSNLACEEVGSYHTSVVPVNYIKPTALIFRILNAVQQT